jgi:hypothetical protein
VKFTQISGLFSEDDAILDLSILKITTSNGRPKICFRDKCINFYFCTVHFDNIKILFTNECTLY